MVSAVEGESFTNAQMVGIALAPKFTALLSIAGSLWIILEVLTEKDKQAMVYHRLLFALSTIDVIASSALFCCKFEG